MPRGAYYEDGSRASGPPPRGLFEYEYQVRDGVLWVRGGQLRRSRGRCELARTRPHPFDGRLARGARGAGAGPSHPWDGAPRSTQYGELVYVFGKRDARVVRAAGSRPASAGARLTCRSADGRVSEPALSELQAPFAWFLRAVHFWGSNAMVAIIDVAHDQVFLFGAHKYPRELTWIVGVFLFLCTLAWPSRAQILQVGSGRVLGARDRGRRSHRRAPGVGDTASFRCCSAVRSSRGARCPDSSAVHVFLVPGILIGMIGLHLWLVLRIGINEWRYRGGGQPRTYRRRYGDEVHRDGVSFFPYAARKDMVACGVVVLAVVLCALLFGPFGPHAFRTRRSSIRRRSRFYFSRSMRCSRCFLRGRDRWILSAVIAIAVLSWCHHRGHGREELERRPVAVLSCW